MTQAFVRWAANPRGRLVLRGLACALLGVALGLTTHLVARGRQAAGSPELLFRSANALPLASVPPGSRLRGELSYGSSARLVVVYFRSDRGQLYEHRPRQGDPGYAVAAFQSAFSQEAGSPLVAGVELEVQASGAGSKLAVFRRGPQPFLEFTLAG